MQNTLGSMIQEMKRLDFNSMLATVHDKLFVMMIREQLEKDGLSQLLDFCSAVLCTECILVIVLALLLS